MEKLKICECVGLPLFNPTEGNAPVWIRASIPAVDELDVRRRNMPRKIPQEIASADDDVISGILLEWSGLSERWQRHELDAICDFTRDVAEHCKHIEIETESWDGGMPGRSGDWHKVTTDDGRILKKEMSDRVTELIRTNRAKTARIKAERQSNNLKELSGPKTSRLLFEVDIWDDFAPTTYVFHIEQPNNSSADYRFWEKKSDGWELTKQTAVSIGVDRKGTQCWGAKSEMECAEGENKWI